jgi:adenylyl-sulfate kinase
MSIENFLKQDAEKDLLRFTTAGSVDDGKSTMIGRLLHDSKQIYEDQLQSVKNASGKINSELEIDYALITDGLKAEREQGITIDVAYRYFSTPTRKFIIADTPGHEQYTRNMATGASTADLAIILIDARNGVLTQSKRHAFISSLLGIPHMLVAVNKMDLVDYSKDVFEKIRRDFSEFASKLTVPDIRFVPISALKGDNVVNSSENMPWHKGDTLLEYLENIYIASDKNLIDLRFPIQSVLRPSLDFRGFSGRIASGVLKKGDEIAVLPSMKQSRVKSIVSFDGEMEQAVASESTTVTLEDEIDISRGDMIVHRHNMPRILKHFEAMVVWMDEKPMDQNQSYYIKHTSKSSIANIDELRYRVDVNTMHRKEADDLKLNEIGRVVFSCNSNLFIDPYGKNKTTGSFILIDRISNNTVAAGMILDREPSENLPSKIARQHDEETIAFPDYNKISMEERIKKFKQKPATLWLTGLVSSGKREIAYKLEKRLFDMGLTCILMDGKSIRSGLSRELNFTAVDRAENLRRVAETSRIINNSGIISICAFVSPSAGIRKQLSEIIGKDSFVEIYSNASLEFCIKRDKTGIYEKAKKGKLENFTGVSALYEAPENPDIVLNPEKDSIDKSVEKIIDFLKDKNFIFPE